MTFDAGRGGSGAITGSRSVMLQGVAVSERATVGAAPESLTAPPEERPSKRRSIGMRPPPPRDSGRS